MSDTHYQAGSMGLVVGIAQMALPSVAEEPPLPSERVQQVCDVWRCMSCPVCRVCHVCAGVVCDDVAE